MNVVLPVTVFYLVPIGIWAYFHLGHSYSSKSSSDQKHLLKSHEYKNGKSNRKFWERIFVSATHCGAGCTIGDVLSTWIIFIGSILLFSSVLVTAFILDFTFAWLLGIIFQYFAIVYGYPIYMLKMIASGNKIKYVKNIYLSRFAIQYYQVQPF